MRFLLIILFLCAIYNGGVAQSHEDEDFVKEIALANAENPIDTGGQYYDILKYVILDELNHYRKKEHADKITIHKALQNASLHHAEYMSVWEQESKEEQGKVKTSGDRAKLYGASENVEEFVTRVNIKDGKEYLSYRQVAQSVVQRLAKSKTDFPKLIDKKYKYAGIGSLLDYKGRKLYVSVVYGSYNTFNRGAEKRKDLAKPYRKFQFFLKHENYKACRKCSQFDDYAGLYNGIYVKDGKIYIKYSNYKQYKRLIKENKDGLAIDIVFKAQYPCDVYNIYDGNLVNKGFLLAPRYKKKLLKKNTIKDRRANAIDTYLGKLPKGIGEEYEFNLLIIKDKHVCKTIKKTYNYIQKSNRKTEFKLYIPQIYQMVPKYIPSSDASILSFVIPFEKNKYSFKTSDIKPILASLNEPKFNIDGVYVFAYSSYEGSNKKNKTLQEQRANSIVETLESMQSTKISEKHVETKDGLELLKRDLKDTKYAYLINKSIEQIKNELNDSKLLAELEPILKKHRFAEIIIDVSYDLTGENKFLFIKDRYEKALQKNAFTEVVSIQRYVFMNAKQDSIDGKKYIKMLQNKCNDLVAYLDILNFKMQYFNLSMEDIYAELVAKQNIFSDNPLYNYNKTLLEFELFDIQDESQIEKYKETISGLYQSSLDSALIDTLNLNLQFKIIDKFFNPNEENDLVIESFRLIKELIDIQEVDLDNALYLSDLFFGNGSYDFAARLLEPHINNFATKKLLFSYISICSYSSEMIFAEKFTKTIKIAVKNYKSDICNLIKNKQLSFQIFDNPYVKDLLCEPCNL